MTTAAKGRFAFVSLGCPKNTVVSERMLWRMGRMVTLFTSLVPLNSYGTPLSLPTAMWTRPREIFEIFVGKVAVAREIFEDYTGSRVKSSVFSRRKRIILDHFDQFAEFATTAMAGIPAAYNASHD